MTALEIGNITLGSDPELFAKNPATNKVVAAYFALNGDVDLPLGDGDTAYPDGAAVEYTVAPSNDPAVVARRAMKHAKTIGERLMAASGTVPIVLSNADVGEYIASLPEEFGKRASLQILGCDADTCVYPDAPPINRPDPKVYPYRTLGGHVHVVVGPEALNDFAIVQFTTALFDAMLGTAGTYLVDDEAARARKKLYGKAGTIRTKVSYSAIEYRTLPAAALVSNERIAHAMFSLAQKSAYAMVNTVFSKGYDAGIELLGDLDVIGATQKAIDDHDVVACRSFQLAQMERLHDSGLVDVETEVVMLQEEKIDGVSIEFD